MKVVIASDFSGFRLKEAEKTSLINNANVLAMGEKVVSYAMGAEMAEKWLAGKWCEGFAEQRRLNNERGYQKLQELEENF